MPSTRLPNASTETPMVVCYVKLGTDDSKAHALLLPDALPPFEWHELDVRPSALQGNGVFPSNSMVKRKRWASTHEIPILLPYFGHETIVHSEHELDVVLKVLQGDFETVLLALRELLTICERGEDVLRAAPHLRELTAVRERGRARRKRWAAMLVGGDAGGGDGGGNGGGSGGGGDGRVTARGRRGGRAHVANGWQLPLRLR